VDEVSGDDVLFQRGEASSYRDSGEEVVTEKPWITPASASANYLSCTMPKLYVYAGMYFFFYSKDHLPIHLHVTYQGCEMKATLLFGTDGTLREVQWARVGKALPPSVLTKADELIRTKAADIAEKWTSRFIYGRSIKPETITKLKP
jgi:hypothetical protein